MSKKADFTPGCLGVSRPDHIREGAKGWGVGSRPAGVTGLGINTRGSPPCASSPELDFWFSFGPWKSTPMPDPPVEEPQSVSLRIGNSNVYRLLKANHVPTCVLSALPQKGPCSRPRLGRWPSQDSAPAPPHCFPKRPEASGFSKTGLISECPSSFPQSTLPSPHFLTCAWVSTSWCHVS